MSRDDSNEALSILRLMLAAQENENRLLAVLVQNQEVQKQRQVEQTNHCDVWKRDNIGLSRRCKLATEKGNNIMTQLVADMVEDLEGMPDDEFGSFSVFEFVDRYGPRFQQFGAMLQIISQLGS